MYTTKINNDEACVLLTWDGCFTIKFESKKKDNNR